ncbi:MAG: UDP-N-acetylmuramate dehydrogenase [Francisellaceae bacterium]
MNSLKPYNTYAIEAYARDLYFPRTIDEISLIYKRHKQVIALGNGSNIILEKPYYEAPAFMVLTSHFHHYYLENHSLYAEAGCLLKTLSHHACEQGLSGLETFYDIPASIGGAMIMNTGAYGDEIYDHIQYVDVLCLKDQKRLHFPKSAIHYGYRHSMFKDNNYLVLGAAFTLTPKPMSDIRHKMDHILGQRLKKLPPEPSGGSVFKRPDYHISVGEMIEKLGLKGYRIGGAEISKKHGGVIVNVDHASGEDILALVTFMKDAIQQHYGVSLELEQIVI